MRCGICERIKKMGKVQVLLIIFICVFMYVVNHFQMKEYRAQRAQEKAQKEQSQLKAYEDLQRKCYFKQDNASCEALRNYE